VRSFHRRDEATVVLSPIERNQMRQAAFIGRVTSLLIRGLHGSCRLTHLKGGRPCFDHPEPSSLRAEVTRASTFYLKIKTITARHGCAIADHGTGATVLSSLGNLPTSLRLMGRIMVARPVIWHGLCRYSPQWRQGRAPTIPRAHLKSGTENVSQKSCVDRVLANLEGDLHGLRPRSSPLDGGAVLLTIQP